MQRNSLTANSSTTQATLTAKLLTKDEARRIAVNIAKLLELLQRRPSWGTA